MLGLYLNKPSELELREFSSVSSLKDDEVKIKLIHAGICGSDIGVFKGKIPHATYPVRPGHELIGTVIEAGKLANYEVGKRVVVGPNTFCDECEYCRKGKKNICINKGSLGVNMDGGFAEEFVISSKFVMPIPEELSDIKAVLIEPFSVIVHALEKVNISKGSSVAIIGCGTEGMLAISLAHYLGANITAIDINKEKLAKAQNSFSGLKAVLPEEIEADSFEIVIEAAGVGASVIQAVDIVKPGGDVVLVGMPQEVKLPIVRVVRKEITIHGSIIYNFPNDFQKSAQFLAQESFNVEPVISKVLPFKEYAQAYEDAVSGKYGKIILDFKEEV
ncbi:zinc-dependent alcohol dehydrogenase [Halalkalibacter krulwichiae]|uniref:Galactitol-1-phosphate 5-dehydrogenase n=1 Tax=Halalkalibacter krulwichiae TaxID=199441 RepID=A0A1X9MCS0_9BACI|nr:alcohol dehydrogenase catalytic domain-containing protein [Halalkalibacter krulwichiae]ARK31208.1 Galactitol-1-phosphate 5-dehydrogenase [Halalkalibacter krulwichiae]